MATSLKDGSHFGCKHKRVKDTTTKGVHSENCLGETYTSMLYFLEGLEDRKKWFDSTELLIDLLTLFSLSHSLVAMEKSIVYCI